MKRYLLFVLNDYHTDRECLFGWNDFKYDFDSIDDALLYAMNLPLLDFATIEVIDTTTKGAAVKNGQWIYCTKKQLGIHLSDRKNDWPENYRIWFESR